MANREYRVFVVLLAHSTFTTIHQDWNQYASMNSQRYLSWHILCVYRFPSFILISTPTPHLSSLIKRETRYINWVCNMYYLLKISHGTPVRAGDYDNGKSCFWLTTSNETYQNTRLLQYLLQESVSTLHNFG